MNQKCFRSINPTTEETLGEFTIFTEDELDLRLRSARITQQNWVRQTLEHRANLIRALGREIQKCAEEAGRLVTTEMGKPIAQARAEVDKCAHLCDYYADRAEQFLTPRPAERNTSSRSYVRFDPLGVVLAIMPWNFPFWQVIRFAVPTLLAGNTTLLKHASNVLGCATMIERLFREAGFPPGCLASLVVSRDQVSELISHPDVRAITLTGSEGAGRAVAEEAGRNLKKCVLELGGSDPFIVLPDADLERTVEKGVFARMQNTGQSCIAAKRFIIHDDIYDRFVEAYVARMKTLKMDDPLDVSTEVGPMAREDLLTELHDQVSESIEQGAVCALGGKRAERPGYFYQPTVLKDVTPGMAAFEEETFGPAAALIRAKDEKTALEMANRSSFGLGASLWTNDVKRAEELASQIESGSVFINEPTRSDATVPFGGVKNSGYGRELAEFGIHEFVNVKTVWVS
ncbi:MAG: NAD-dependent succinate-semialdehyde dehydrogenase [Planctomycetaceae bacterium]|nr:NAD-dependent succinate-semialdehyde dehydrogenase [Planctomycetaceae bacterium]